jgi:hypothetical protein
MIMHIEFTTPRERGYVLHVVKRVGARARVGNNALAAVLVVLGGLAFIAGGTAVILGIEIAALGLVLLVANSTGPRRVLRRLSDRMFLPHTYTFTDTGLRVATEDVRGEYNWSVFVAATATPHALLLWRERRVGAMDVPRAGFTAGQWDEVQGFLRRRGLLPADGEAGPAGPLAAAARGEPAVGSSGTSPALRPATPDPGA